jgi:hypothetical protein
MCDGFKSYCFERVWCMRALETKIFGPQILQIHVTHLPIMVPKASRQNILGWKLIIVNRMIIAGDSNYNF